MKNILQIEVVYCETDLLQHAVLVEAFPGCTAESVIQKSGLLQQSAALKKNPEIQTWSLGCYGHRIQATDVITESTRIEIYRSLRADPKQARKKRL